MGRRNSGGLGEGLEFQEFWKGGLRGLGLRAPGFRVCRGSLGFEVLQFGDFRGCATCLGS